MPDRQKKSKGTGTKVFKTRGTELFKCQPKQSSSSGIQGKRKTESLSLASDMTIGRKK